MVAGVAEVSESSSVAVPESKAAVLFAEDKSACRRLSIDLCIAASTCSDARRTKVVGFAGAAFLGIGGWQGGGEME